MRRRKTAKGDDEGDRMTAAARVAEQAALNILSPLLNLALAFAAAGAVAALVGVDPLAALSTLIYGAFGYGEAVGYTLYYTTSFIFVGLAVASPFRAGLFNIGGEGQAMLGGLGCGLIALALPGGPWPLVAVLGVIAAAGFGAVWGAVPGLLQARRGSHIVITTIMFNFIAAGLMTWLMVDVLIAPGQQSPQSAPFAAAARLPSMADFAAGFGLNLPQSPLNPSFFLALACCLGCWLYVSHTRWGYALRTAGAGPAAALYAGISPGRQTVIAMALAGAFAGAAGVNEILGVHHKIILNFTGGMGFVGIAVALMGRNHPLGVIPAALLFGGLYQGGSELSFEFPELNRELVVVIQGLAVLFTGALENLLRRPLAVLLGRAFRRRSMGEEAA
jgi:general nucleoside transport system permease protein